MRSHSRRRGLTLLVFWLAASYTVEQPFSRTVTQEKDEVYVLGAGNTACPVWTAARARQSAVMDMLSSWVQGYLTGSADRQAMVYARIRLTANDKRVSAARSNYCSAPGLWAFSAQSCGWLRLRRRIETTARV